MAQWKIRRGGKEYGPFTTQQVNVKSRAGKIRETDLIARWGTDNWDACEKLAQILSGSQAVDSTTSHAVNENGDATAVHSDDWFPQMPGNAESNDSANEQDQGAWAPPRLKKVFTGLGGVIGVVVLAWNGCSILYNGYLQTDAAVIALLEESMEETLGESGLQEPVDVSGIQLKGEGSRRTGTAVVQAGDDREVVRFTVEIKKGFGRNLQVSWEIVP